MVALEKDAFGKCALEMGALEMGTFGNGCFSKRIEINELKNGLLEKGALGKGCFGKKERKNYGRTKTQQGTKVVWGTKVLCQEKQKIIFSKFVFFKGLEKKCFCKPLVKKLI